MADDLKKTLDDLNVKYDLSWNIVHPSPPLLFVNDVQVFVYSGTDHSKGGTTHPKHAGQIALNVGAFGPLIDGNQGFGLMEAFLAATVLHEMEHSAYDAFLDGFCEANFPFDVAICQAGLDAVKECHKETYFEGIAKKGACHEMVAYTNTAKAMCERACASPPNSTERASLMAAANQQGEKAGEFKSSCDTATALCGPLPQPPGFSNLPEGWTCMCTGA